jgi:hypothetical protein
MRKSLACLAVAATAATVLGTTAIPAFADPVPSDCTVTKVAWDTRSMTCTNRPAGQHWAFTMVCTSIGGHERYDGNVVTGNGTSTVSCGAYPNDGSYQIQYYN